MTAEIDTKENAEILAAYMDEQINSLIEITSAIRKSPLLRVSELYPLFGAIIEDAISIRLLGNEARLNQMYIISRALLERLINFCFLQLCTDDEFKDYLDYTLNKIGRRMDQKVEVKGEVKARIALKDGDIYLSPEHINAIAKFTSERGREKTRWTTIPLPDRAAVVDTKLRGRTGLLMSLLVIYSDASEALHGTIYGALFHLGAFDVGSVPHDQESLDRHRYSTLSMLYLMVGGAITTLLTLLKTVNEPNIEQVALASKARSDVIAIRLGIIKPNS